MRPLSVSDAAGLLPVKNNRDAAQLLESEPPVFTLETMQKWITFHLEKKENKLFILEDIAHRQIIGHCGLYDIGFAATMATIAEARKIDGIHQIHLHVLKENTRAIHIYEKAGFKTTRILTAHVVKNGMAKDIVHMTLQLI
jgi:RimJ/RimL family protein N-acetyltransferase